MPDGSNRRPTPRGRKPNETSPHLRLPLWKKFLFSALAMTLCFAALEAGLALLGVKPVLYERDPYVGFSSYLPLFVAKTGTDGRVMMVTAKNKLRFFNAQAFPRTKAPGVFRIFSLGASTTYGRPFDDATSYTGWLRQYLKALAPNRKWEVINAGGISYASYRVARLMEELIRYQPDLFIICTGHNEFLEERTYGKLKARPRVLLALGSFLDRLRMVTVLNQALRSLLPSTRRQPLAQSVLPGEVVTKLDNTVGPSVYHRDDRLKDQILRHYRFNLERMVGIARSAGAKVILITPASNLSGISPFKSEHRGGLSRDHLRRWQQAYNQGRADLEKGANARALAALDQAARLDDHYADLEFLRGQVLVKLGRYSQAKAAYERARDEDICPLRALSPMPEIVKQVAADRQVPCVDFVAIQDSLAPHGIPGSDGFYDHVHPTIERHRLLALELLKTMQKAGLANPNWDPMIIKQVTAKVESRLNPKSQAEALMNLSKVLGWAGKLSEAYQLAVRAAQMDPTSPEVQYQAGLCAQILNQNQEAIGYYRRTVALAPTAAPAQGNLGVALERQGNVQEAIQHYRLAIQYGTPADIARNQRNLARAQAKLNRGR